MKRNLSIFAGVALVCAASSLFAQEKPRVSPHETVNATVNGDEIKVVYGRPYTKDPKSGQARKVWGELVPNGKVWRLGADEATLFTTSKAIEMGGKTIPAGTYSLYMMPEDNGAKLIVNKQTGQWGTKYDESQDLARIDLQKTNIDQAVDQLTIAVDDRKDGGVLKMSWEKAQYAVPFTVKG